MRRCFFLFFSGVFSSLLALLLLLLPSRKTTMLGLSLLLSRLPLLCSAPFGPRHDGGTAQWDQLEGSSGVLDTKGEVAPRDATAVLK